MKPNLSIAKLLKSVRKSLAIVFRPSRKLRLKNIELLRTLINATSCCSRCGLLYGEPREGVSTSVKGICHICGQEALLKDTRHYAYLRKGVRKLSDSVRH
jgi:hypothetical protein